MSDKKRKTRNFNQIIRVDGKNCFFEIMNNAFPINQVLINFVEYNPASGNKQLKKIPIYIKIPEFLYITHSFLSYRFLKEAGIKKQEKNCKVEEAKKQGKEIKYIYTQEVYKHLGGVSVKQVKENRTKILESIIYPVNISDGKAISKQFKIVPGDKLPWVFSAELGEGEEKENGLIAPLRPQVAIRVPMEESTIIGVMKMVELYLNAYYFSSFNTAQDFIQVKTTQQNNSQ
jgi:hypothetical protein